MSILNANVLFLMSYIMCCRSLAKPRFLEQLEGHLKRELEALDTHSPKVQELRLQVYIPLCISLLCFSTHYGLNVWGW